MKMKKIKFKVCSVCLLLITITMSCSKDADILELEQMQSMTATSSVEVSNDEIYNWIGRYTDDTKLAGLTLLGSHDAGTYELRSANYFPLNIMAACQSRGFTEQIERGVRVFDCRLSENMNFFHGSYYCHASLHNFVGASIDFLNKHPREFIIALVKAENAEGPGYVYNKHFQEVVDRYGRNNFLFDKDLLNQPISKLRGKIVIVTRYYEKESLGYIEGAPQINWPDNTTQNPTSENNGCLRVGISDRYTAEPGTKTKVVKEVFPEILSTLEKDPTRWFIFYTTGYDSGARNKCNPFAYVEYFREEGGQSAIIDRIAYLKKGGTIMLDFIEEWTYLRNYIFVHTAPSSKSVSE